MARPIVLSNGEMHVGIDSYGLIQDFYYPYVGLENHTLGRDTRHRIGVWANGEISWLDDDSWEIHFDYQDEALIGITRAVNRKLQIELRLNDTVDSELCTFMRNIHVVNLADETRDVRVFLHQAFVIGDSRSNTDTAQYLPDINSIVHYRGRRVFVVSAESDEGPFDQHSIGLFGIDAREGTYKDAEDGELSMNKVECGQVDSVLRFKFDMEPNTFEHISYSISAGKSMRDAIDVDKTIKSDGMATRFDATTKWWKDWLQPTIAVADILPDARRRHFVRSIMILKSHIDKRGAVIASTDSTAFDDGQDTYGYTLPRDTAYILWPLIRLGYTAEPLATFDFYRRAMHDDGYLSHKYRADGALGSSWQPYVHEDGIIAEPIQTDETATMLFMFTQFYHAHPTSDILHKYYLSFVKPIADFLSAYIDPETSLPKPSYDLWGEEFLTTTYTASATYAALLAATELAELAHDNQSAVAWRAAAEDIQGQSVSRLYNQERQCLNRGYKKRSDSSIDSDSTIDVSSVFGAFMFGLLPLNSHEITSSINTMCAIFNQPSNIGLPRSEDDTCGHDRSQKPFSFWHIASLWYAQYCIEAGDVDMAEKIVKWVEDNSCQSGILTEQVSAGTDGSHSIAPLAWSHAEYVATVLDLLGQTVADEVVDEH